MAKRARAAAAPSVQVTVAVKQSAGVKSYAVLIDGTDVTTSKSTTLNPGNHTLHWWFVGGVGEQLDITVTRSGDTKPAITVSDQIPPGFTSEAGDKPFTI
jgi:hypothetical protein